MGNKDLKFEVLISTMNKTSLSFLDQIFVNNELEGLLVLIINQTELGKELTSNFNNIRVINSYEKGLSKSRNLAINNAIGDICLIADDDVEYLNGFSQVILKSFLKSVEASIITFKIKTFSNKPYKSYSRVSKNLKKRKDLFRISSIEIAFKRQSILEAGVTFNHLFGLGSKFNSGEEYLFLRDSFRKGLNINFENNFIVQHSIERSTSDMGSNAFVRTMSAIYYYDYKNLSYLYLIKFVFFLLRKRIIKLDELAQKLLMGIKAIKEYKGINYKKHV